MPTTTAHTRKAVSLRAFNDRLAVQWARVGTRFMPFADAASPDLPLSRLLRLALFQVSVGVASALLVGTLNRVMIVELGMAAWLVALMVALPLLAAPFRALIGYRSDTHRSSLGWRRVPYLWFGSLLQFGGLSILPFALLVMAPGAGVSPQAAVFAHAAAALAVLMVGVGMQTTQTASLALATDLASDERRPRVVALMYLMLLVGMVVASIGFSVALRDFSPTRMVGVVQGAAVLTLGLNILALWKQEARRTSVADRSPSSEPFRRAWQRLVAQPTTRRFLVGVALGSAAFSMQDVVLEPYGAVILKLPVASTSLLTAGLALGSVSAFALAARRLQRGTDPYRLAAIGALIGVFAFAAVIFAAPLASPALFRVGNVLIGLGGGLFAVGTLTVAMGLQSSDRTGLALGAWGAVQASAAGSAIALGGFLRDAVLWLAETGRLGEAMSEASVPYSVVYHLEIALLFGTLIALGPLVRPRNTRHTPARPFGLADFPA
jgi:BCD family chlorophyll transporter-like MFS transporter